MLHAWKASTRAAEEGHCCSEFEDILSTLGCLDYSLKPCLKTTTNPGSGPSLFVFVGNLKVARRNKP